MKKLIVVILLLITLTANAQWEKVYQVSIYQLSKFAVQNDSMMLATWGAYRSLNNGKTWIDIYKGILETGIQDIIKYKNRFIIGTANGVFITTNFGETWFPPNNSALSNKFACGLINKEDTLLCWTEKNGVYSSIDGGNNWNLVNSQVSSWCEGMVLIDGNIIVNSDSGIFLSNNTGSSWEKIGKRPEYFYSLIAIKKYLFGGSSTGIYRSTDLGNTWELIKLQQNGGGIQFCNIGDVLIAGTERFVAYSTDYGINWVDLTGNDEFFFGSIRGIVATTKALITCGGDGIFRRSLPEAITSSKQNNFILPTSFSLSQNYPNPFNPETTINYHLPTSGLVTLKVYDLLGREVATLVDEYKQTGNYKTTLNVGHFERSREMVSGVYFYRLQSGSYSETKKLIMMK